MTEMVADLMAAENLLNPGTDFHGELVTGRIVAMAPASWGHRLHGRRALLRSPWHVDEHGSGRVFTADTGFLLRHKPDLVHALNVAFVWTPCIESQRTTAGSFDGPPDSAVASLSLSDRMIQVEAMIDDFLTANCPSVWLISPMRRTITIHGLDCDPASFEGSETLIDDAVPRRFA